MMRLCGLAGPDISAYSYPCLLAPLEQLFAAGREIA